MGFARVLPNQLGLVSITKRHTKYPQLTLLLGGKRVAVFGCCGLDSRGNNIACLHNGLCALGLEVELAEVYI